MLEQPQVLLVAKRLWALDATPGEIRQLELDELPLAAPLLPFAVLNQKMSLLLWHSSSFVQQRPEWALARLLMTSPRLALPSLFPPSALYLRTFGWRRLSASLSVPDWLI